MQHTRLIISLLALHLAFGALPSRYSTPVLQSARRIARIRGGAALETSPKKEQKLQVIVSTSVGSKWLDKQARLQVDPSCTIWELKQQIASSFPGNPPPSIQRLFYGTRLLHDEDKLVDVVPSNIPRIPLLLDHLPTTTTQYATASSVDELLSAAAALKATIQYTQDMATALADESRRTQTLTSPTIDTAIYRRQVQSEQAAMQSVYARELESAHKLEMDPVLTIPGSDKANATYSPLMLALIKQLNPDIRAMLPTVSVLLYFILALVLQGGSALPVVLFAPVVVLSMLRPARYWMKVLFYMLPPLEGHLSFLSPFFSAPATTILRCSNVWEKVVSDSEEHEEQTEKQLKTSEDRVDDENETTEEDTEEDTEDIIDEE